MLTVFHNASSSGHKWNWFLIGVNLLASVALTSGCDTSVKGLPNKYKLVEEYRGSKGLVDPQGKVILGRKKSEEGTIISVRVNANALTVSTENGYEYEVLTDVQTLKIIKVGYKDGDQN